MRYQLWTLHSDTFNWFFITHGTKMSNYAHITDVFDEPIKYIRLQKVLDKSILVSEADTLEELKYNNPWLFI